MILTNSFELYKQCRHNSNHNKYVFSSWRWIYMYVYHICGHAGAVVIKHDISHLCISSPYCKIKWNEIEPTPSQLTALENAWQWMDSCRQRILQTCFAHSENDRFIFIIVWCIVRIWPYRISTSPNLTDIANFKFEFEAHATESRNVQRVCAKRLDGERKKTLFENLWKTTVTMYNEKRIIIIPDFPYASKSNVLMIGDHAVYKQSITTKWTKINEIFAEI